MVNICLPIALVPGVRVSGTTDAAATNAGRRRGVVERENDVVTDAPSRRRRHRRRRRRALLRIRWTARAPRTMIERPFYCVTFPTYLYCEYGSDRSVGFPFIPAAVYSTMRWAFFQPRSTPFSAVRMKKKIRNFFPLSECSSCRKNYVFRDFFRSRRPPDVPGLYSVCFFSQNFRGIVSKPFSLKLWWTEIEIRTRICFVLFLLKCCK